MKDNPYEPPCWLVILYITLITIIFLMTVATRCSLFLIPVPLIGLISINAHVTNVDFKLRSEELLQESWFRVFVKNCMMKENLYGFSAASIICFITSLFI